MVRSGLMTFALGDEASDASKDERMDSSSILDRMLLALISESLSVN